MQCFSVCVYCGSRRGAKPIYAQEASALGTGLAERGWRLVYGAGDVGLMGNVARAAQAAGGETFGVIPTHLLQLEVGKQDLSSFIVTENMHERKKVMFMNCDAVVLMPGGAGSLDEFFEVLTWRIGAAQQTRYHPERGWLLGSAFKIGRAFYRRRICRSQHSRFLHGADYRNRRFGLFGSVARRKPRPAINHHGNPNDRKRPKMPIRHRLGKDQ